MITAKLIAASICLSLGATAGIAAGYEIEGRAHQAAASNREEADITVIRCSNGNQYYIYAYYRESGPNYRAIIPPYWGNALGGGDHDRWEKAVAAACYQS